MQYGHPFMQKAKIKKKSILYNDDHFVAYNSEKERNLMTSSKTKKISLKQATVPCMFYALFVCSAKCGQFWRQIISSKRSMFN